jgi:hypothetical protein
MSASSLNLILRCLRHYSMRCYAVNDIAQKHEGAKNLLNFKILNMILKLKHEKSICMEQKKIVTPYI